MVDSGGDAPDAGDARANGLFNPATNATKVHDHFCVGDEVCRLADVNGDGRADLVAFARSSQPGAAEGDVWVSFATRAGAAEHGSPAVGRPA